MGDRKRRTATYSSTSYRTSSSTNRSTFGYWVPLVLTVTAATVGLAAWIWSERRDDEESSQGSHEHYPGVIPPPGYSNMSGTLPPGPGPAGFQGPSGPMPPGPPQQGGFEGRQEGVPPHGGAYQENRAVSTSIEQNQESGIVSRMTNALGINQTASPAQGGNWASKQMAAAGAMVGGALSYVRGNEEFSDQERWSEEADKPERSTPRKGLVRQGTAEEFYSGAVEVPRRSSVSARKRKTIAVVVSAASELGGDMDVGGHASILAHLPEYVKPETTRIFVLIYAPELRVHPLSPTATRQSRRPSQSMASSFSNISQADAHTPAQTPGDFPSSGSGDEGILAYVDPNPMDESSNLYKTLHNQAMTLVDRDTMILPFNTPQGHKHILKSIQPETVYIQESLCGSHGEVVSELGGWVRQMVVVIGDEGGIGGLVDTDDEIAARDRRGSSKRSDHAWWKKEERTGVGRGVAVVESLKVGDDWRRRVNEED